MVGKALYVGLGVSTENRGLGLGFTKKKEN
jgi:hypothetical protein